MSDHKGIGSWRQTSDLELAARHPGLPIGLHLAPDISKRLALDIVAPDRDDRDLVAEAADNRRVRKPGQLQP